MCGFVEKYEMDEEYYKLGGGKTVIINGLEWNEEAIKRQIKFLKEDIKYNKKKLLMYQTGLKDFNKKYINNKGSEK